MAATGFIDTFLFSTLASPISVAALAKRPADVLLERMRLVDLFCGTGGFSTGAQRAGLSVALAVDIDPVLTSSHELNFPETKLLREDISALSGSHLEQEAGGPIDGIFGGPPCQGFSSIGRRDPADGRRKLLRHFFRLISETKPAFFVMENVRGVIESTGRGELEEALSLVEDNYSVSDPQVWDASSFGAATARKRVFVIGTHKDKCDAIAPTDIEKWRRPASTVRQAIADLQHAQFVDVDTAGFDRWRAESGGESNPYAESLRSADHIFTGHRPTVHTEKVVTRFSRIAGGETDPIGRHQRLDWNAQCPTLRAGTGADKGSYQSVRPLHPVEDRVITVREAARLQGFPDSHRFHPTIWHSFRMIGNSVPPMMGEAILRAVASKLSDAVIPAPMLLEAAE